MPDNDVDAEGDIVNYSYQRMNGVHGCPVAFSLNTGAENVARVYVAGTMNEWGGDNLSEAWPLLDPDGNHIWNLSYNFV